MVALSAPNAFFEIVFADIGSRQLLQPRLSEKYHCNLIPILLNASGNAQIADLYAATGLFPGGARESFRELSQGEKEKRRERSPE